MGQYQHIYFYYFVANKANISFSSISLLQESEWGICYFKLKLYSLLIDLFKLLDRETLSEEL